MRKIRIISILLLLISTVIFGVFKVYEKIGSDNKAPEISFDSEELTVSVEDEEDALLKDVKAVDNRSGDVSDAVVVEKLSDFTEEGVRMITYAVIDKNGNVGRRERVLRYKDYKEPKIEMKKKLRYPIGQQVDVLEYIRAESSLDGDLKNNVKYTLESTINIMNPGKYPIEFRVMDSAGKVTYLETNVEMYDPSKEHVR